MKQNWRPKRKTYKIVVNDCPLAWKQPYRKWFQALNQLKEQQQKHSTSEPIQVYWEKQNKHWCGLHTVNTILVNLGLHPFTRSQWISVGMKLDFLETKLFSKSSNQFHSKNVNFLSGASNITVVEKSLRDCGFQLQKIEKDVKDTALYVQQEFYSIFVAYLSNRQHFKCFLKFQISNRCVGWIDCDSLFVPLFMSAEEFTLRMAILRSNKKNNLYSVSHMNGDLIPAIQLASKAVKQLFQKQNSQDYLGRWQTIKISQQILQFAGQPLTPGSTFDLDTKEKLLAEPTQKIATASSSFFVPQTQTQTQTQTQIHSPNQIQIQTETRRGSKKEKSNKKSAQPKTKSM